MSPADVGVPIDPAAEGLQAVIQVKRTQTLEADQPIGPRPVGLQVHG